MRKLLSPRTMPIFTASLHTRGWPAQPLAGAGSLAPHTIHQVVEPRWQKLRRPGFTWGRWQPCGHRTTTHFEERGIPKRWRAKAASIAEYMVSISTLYSIAFFVMVGFQSLQPYPLLPRIGSCHPTLLSSRTCDGVPQCQ